MERTFAATIVAILITAALVLSAVALSGGFSESENAAVQTENVPVAPESESPSEKMTLGIYSGHIALFIGDGRYPNEIYEVLVRSLPESDIANISESSIISPYPHSHLTSLAIVDFRANQPLHVICNCRGKFSRTPPPRSASQDSEARPMANPSRVPWTYFRYRKQDRVPYMYKALEPCRMGFAGYGNNTRP